MRLSSKRIGSSAHAAEHVVVYAPRHYTLYTYGHVQKALTRIIAGCKEVNKNIYFTPTQRTARDVGLKRSIRRVLIFLV